MGIIYGVLANGNFFIPTAAICHGRMPVKTTEGRHGLLREDGSVVGQVKYDAVIWFNDDCASVCLNGSYLFLDKEGQELKETFEETAELFAQWAAGKKNDRWYLIDVKKKKVSTQGYNRIYYTSGYAFVQVGLYYGVIDMDGEVIVSPEFEEIRYCSEGKFAVRRNHKEKFALADRTGVLTEFEFTHIGHFYKGVSKAEKHSSVGRLNEKGEWSI